ncbi:hypothetical protein OAC78_09345 [Litorivicinus sp.]|nr:hypothetical protein [Litorivicinus sp.]
MAWFWIVIGLLSVIGSITWILPSPIERRQGNRRMEALSLGMKVRLKSLSNWEEQRLELTRLPQYLLWTDQKPRSFTLWRIPERESPWIAPPDSSSWDLLDSPLMEVLDRLPDEVYGLGAEAGAVWLALDDARGGLEPSEIRDFLNQILSCVRPKEVGKSSSSFVGND